MNIVTLLKKINSINEYISITEEAAQKCKISRIQLNMSNVLALTKIRSLEIEHINKCEQNGIASIIFERLLSLPPSKTWEVLSKEMVNLLQYWLDAVRKRSVKYSAHWWTFLKLLLHCARELRTKSSSLPNMLVEHISECLLDLATAAHPDAVQRYEILHCFNLFCSESSREIRFALRNQLEHYFIKLSIYMSTCGHLPTQYSILETMLRWLVPRHDRFLRVASATKWFPSNLYAESTVDIFLERSWMDFFQDARDFLNTHNVRSDLIISVVCTKLSVGHVVVISEKQHKDAWLDVNITTKCVSVLLDPRSLQKFSNTNNYKCFETLIVAEENIHSAKLYRESEHLMLSVKITSAPCIYPSCLKLCNEACDLIAELTSHNIAKRLDAALRTILDQRYQLLFDLEEEMVPHSFVAEPSSVTGSEARVNLPRGESSGQKHIGVITRNPVSCTSRSPSSISTTSLIQLPEKLAALPRYIFDKEVRSVCASPKLSIVRETSETSRASTFKYKRYGVCLNKRNEPNSIREWKSDNESIKRNQEFGKRVNDVKVSSVGNDNTIGNVCDTVTGTDGESVINDLTSNVPISPFNGDNIVDLLMQEASSELEKDSGVVTGDKKSQYVVENIDAIENTPLSQVSINMPKKKYSKVISSTSDDSNTDALSDTPNVYVSTRRANKYVSKLVDAKKTLTDQANEDFFSQHIAEYRMADTVTSLSEVKKINVITSGSSKDVLDNNLNLMADNIHNVEPVNFDDIEVIECLNSIVDKVCVDLEKCTKYLSNEQVPNCDSDIEYKTPLQDIMNTIKNIDKNNHRMDKKPITQKNIKLRYKAPKKDKTKSRLTKNKNRPGVESKSKMSPIAEDKSEFIDNDSKKSPSYHEQNVIEKDKIFISDSINKTTTPLLRKKRKLFSPKDEHIEKQIVPLHSQHDDNNETDVQINKTPKSSAVRYKPYKDIEMERRKHLRLPRNRKSKIIECPSPRSKKINDLFDEVVHSNNNEQVKLTEKTTKLDVYNFSSDSEDDFQQKKIATSKKSSPLTLNSDCIISSRNKNTKRVRGSNKRGKTIRKSNKTKKDANFEPVKELIDERMRESKQISNTSVIMELPKTIITEPEPLLEKAPEMEFVSENVDNLKKNKNITKRKNTKRKPVEVGKTTKKNLNVELDVDVNSTVSPLPGLVVEKARNKNKEYEVLPAEMVEKFKEIFRNPEKYIDESNSAQNMPLDNERNVCSPVIVHDLTHTELENNAQFKSKLKCSRPKKYISQEGKSVAQKVKTTKDNVSLCADEIKSEKSIATIGITAHCDSEEAPPSPRLINQRLHPRNVHTDYLDHSTKSYFNKLREEINEMYLFHNNSNCSNRSLKSKVSEKQAHDFQIKNVDSPMSVLSPKPVVSMRRLSSEDIKKWLPSSRNSESDDQSHRSSILKQNSKSAEKVKSTELVALGNNSDDDDELILSPKQPLQSYKKTKIENVNTDSSKKNIQGSVKCNIKKRVQPQRNAKLKCRSSISPIKLCNDLISNADKLSQNDLSEDEDYMTMIKETSRDIQNNKIRSEIGNTEKEISVNLIESGSSCDNVSTSTKIVLSKTLKRSSEECSSSSKKKKIDDILSLPKSISSIYDWFNRNEPCSSRTVESDSIRSVMEKLDTTLIEIHQSTSNKLVQFIMSAQQRCTETEKERRSMYKMAAQDILSTMIKVMDEKFDDLDKKSQEMDRNFIKHIKQEFSSVIREDCQQKRAMVMLLREDVEAVLQHDRRKTE